MKNLLQTSVLLSVAALALSRPVSGFSLIGAPDPSQTTDIAYFTSGTGLRTYSQQGDLGGPRNLGAEFRWSTPVITYGFDATFLDFFGTNGVAAVNRAFAILNAVPAASKMTPGLKEFPLRTSGVNFAAQRLHLYDLKSFTLSIMLEQLGLAAPERWVWCIKQRLEVAGVNDFLVINRNYDPVSQVYSPFVNGTRYSFVMGRYTLPDNTIYYSTRKVAIDAAEPNVTVAALHGIQAGIAGIDDRVDRITSYNFGNSEGSPAVGSWGLYFSGLTRDDAGGLRYLLDPRNKNYEAAPLGSAGLSGTATSVGSGSSGGGGGSSSSPWRIVDDGLVIVDPGTGGGTGGVATNATTTPFTNEAVRSGVDKISFVQVDLDPLTRRTTRPLAVQYSEQLTTNGVTFNQRVERIINQPDILISAADLGATQAIPFVYNRTLNFTSPARNAAGVVNNPNNALAYPGNINGTVDITFSSLGPHYLPIDPGSSQGNASYGFLWGNFDGTTNRPVAFPEGRLDLIQLEKAALDEN